MGDELLTRDTAGCCASCVYSRPGIDEHLECHHNAPLPALLANGQQNGPAARWPAVEPDDWCGKYCPAPPTQAQLTELSEWFNRAVTGLRGEG